MKKLYYQSGLNDSQIMVDKGLWALQILLALVFLTSGSLKLIGAEPVVAIFEKIGIGQWFRLLTGSIEVISAVLLLIPRFARLGALSIITTMTGAILTHLLVIGGNPAGAVVMMSLAIIIAWKRSK
jgi:putative oxidoreductase